MAVRFSLDSDGQLLGPHGTRVADIDIPALVTDDDEPLPLDASDDDGLTLLIAEILSTARLKAR